VFSRHEKETGPGDTGKGISTSKTRQKVIAQA